LNEHRDSLVTFCSDVRAELISNAADAAAASQQPHTQKQQQPGDDSQPDADGGGGDTRRRQQHGSNDGSNARVGSPDAEAAFSDVESLADTLNAGSEDEEEGVEGDMVPGSDGEGDDTGM
jgi:hypothetical protein